MAQAARPVRLADVASERLGLCGERSSPLSFAAEDLLDLRWLTTKNGPAWKERPDL